MSSGVTLEPFATKPADPSAPTALSRPVARFGGPLSFRKVPPPQVIQPAAGPAALLGQKAAELAPPAPLADALAQLRFVGPRHCFTFL